ncbi:uncharacterized protein RJT21DRAFT_111233 [Scheffersomyces amazonensis]|uniref:uncharacterized protein n=1 Tax=Scheffersomyces amazonensis TaxID=1078765 RepID=UPI00315D4468
MSTPPTPLHNEDVHELPSGPLPASLLANIEIEDDEDDEDEDMEAVNQPILHLPSKFTENIQNQIANIDSVDSEASLEDVDLREMKQITLPFEEAFDIMKISLDEFEPNLLTEHQQSKLVNYIDEKLLSLQRKFIRNKAETLEVYSLQDLLEELSSILAVIWTSIEKKNPLFGQEEYYIKVVGDLEDYLKHYTNLFNDKIDLNIHLILRFDNNKLINFFLFFQKLDLQISLLIDGYKDINNRIQKLNSTHLVRLFPIISRLRISIIYKIDQVRQKLSKLAELPDTGIQTKQEANSMSNLLDLEVSRLFEGILDRST